MLNSAQPDKTAVWSGATLFFSGILFQNLRAQSSRYEGVFGDN